MPFERHEMSAPRPVILQIQEATYPVEWVLRIDSNAMAPSLIALEKFEPIPCWHYQIIQACGGVNES
jgi:hypothetical protein